MHIFWKASVALLLCASVAWALQESKDKSKAGEDAQAALQAVQKDFNALSEELVGKFRAAKTDADREAIKADFYKRAAVLVPRFLAVAEKHPKTPTAVQALLPAVVFGQESKEGARAAELLLANHLDDEQFGAHLLRAASSQSVSAEKLLRGVLEKATKKDLQGTAALGLAQHLRARSVEAGKSNKALADKLAAEAEKSYELVVAKYGDVRVGEAALGEAAKGELYEFKFLSIGKVAPDIEGEDTDGKRFKLSDYRGKVVLMDFWAHW